MILPTFFFTRLCLDCLGTRFHEIRLRASALPEFLFYILAFKSLESLLTKKKIFHFLSETTYYSSDNTEEWIKHDLKIRLWLIPFLENLCNPCLLVFVQFYIFFNILFEKEKHYNYRWSDVKKIEIYKWLKFLTKSYEDVQFVFAPKNLQSN